MVAVTLSEVQSVLSRQKFLTSDMVWSTRRGKLEWQWHEARIPLQFADEAEVREGFYVMCQWKRQCRSIPEQWKFAVFFNNERIYAIDVQLASMHTNDKAGRGRPLHLQDIGGIHEHTWSNEGYGYAEPIDVPVDKQEVIWKIFLRRAGISEADFFHPDNNQPELRL